VLYEPRLRGSRSEARSVVSASASPFGFRRGDVGELVEVPAEQEAIREIVALRAQRKPLRAIAEAVAAKGHRLSGGRAPGCGLGTQRLRRHAQADRNDNAAAPRRMAVHEALALGLRYPQDDVAVALLQSAQRPELVHNGRRHPNEIVAVLRALRLDADSSPGQRPRDRRIGGGRDGDADHAVKRGVGPVTRDQ
jgi:hypothetical protein